MKLTHLLSVATALLVLASPAAFAGKGKGKAAGLSKEDKKAARKAAQALARYDTNSDGAITGDESAGLRQAFKVDPLRLADLNSDGTLGDSEIAAIKIVKHGKKGEKAGKGAKKKKDA